MKYMSNNPDMYSMGGEMLDSITGLKARPGPGMQLPPAMPGAASALAQAALATPAPVADGDESPATAKDAVKAEKPADKAADESPATAKDPVKVDDKGETPSKEGEPKTMVPILRRALLQKEIPTRLMRSQRPLLSHRRNTMILMALRMVSMEKQSPRPS